jgi:hypothetical protein
MALRAGPPRQRKSISRGLESCKDLAQRRIEKKDSISKFITPSRASLLTLANQREPGNMVVPLTNLNS